MSLLFRRLSRLLKSSLLSSEAPDTSSEKFTEWQSHSGYTSAKSVSEDTPENAYYRALELPLGASFEEVKKAYKDQMKKYHPDRFHNQPQKKQYAETVTQRLNEAYSYFENKFGR